VDLPPDFKELLAEFAPRIDESGEVTRALVAGTRQCAAAARAFHSFSMMSAPIIENGTRQNGQIPQW
jgi:hypothetical protein